MIDLVLLQIVKNREDYEYYRPMVRDHLVDDTTKQLLIDFKAYFEHYDHDSVNWDVFGTWFKQFRHPNMKSDKLAFYEKLFDRIALEPDEDLAKRLRGDLINLNFATIVSNYAQDLLDGKIDGDFFLHTVQEQIDKTIDEQRNSSDIPWDDSDLSDMVENISYDNGLKFRLGCLDESCGSLPPSKFVVVGAYVDAGKSTFLADQFAANMAEQAATVQDKWYSGRPVIWFNNEGSTRDIRMYCYQSLFGCSASRIMANPTGVQEAIENKLGSKDMIRVVPCQGWHIKDAERVIRDQKPCVVIYDMLDNFSGFETDGTIDQRYRALYDYARQMSDKHEHVAVATSQCVGEANGLERIEMHMLAGSRVAKQSTADLMINIGRSLEIGKHNTRFIYTPKNKMQSQPSQKFDRFTNTEVIFNGEVKRFLDPVE